MAKINASPKKKVQAKLNTSGKLMAPPADPSVNAPRKFSGFTGKEQQHIYALTRSNVGQSQTSCRWLAPRSASQLQRPARPAPAPAPAPAPCRPPPLPESRAAACPASSLTPSTKTACSESSANSAPRWPKTTATTPRRRLSRSSCGRAPAEVGGLSGWAGFYLLWPTERFLHPR